MHTIRLTTLRQLPHSHMAVWVRPQLLASRVNFLPKGLVNSNNLDLLPSNSISSSSQVSSPFNLAHLRSLKLRLCHPSHHLLERQHHQHKAE